VKAWVLLALVACGGPAATTGGGTTGVVSNTATPSGPDVHRSRHSIVKAAAAALVAGDTEALVALAGTKHIYDKALSCSKATADEMEGGVRERFGKAAQKSKGGKVEVLHVEQLTRGSFSEDGCTSKKELAIHLAQVRVRAERDGKPSERTVEFSLYELNDRWYLAAVPDDLARGGLGNPMEVLSEFADRMCECKDKACADKVNEDYTKWGTEMARKAKPDDYRKHSPDDIRKMTEAATKYTECYTKLAMAAGNPCSP
jgi:hypothetical protein